MVVIVRIALLGLSGGSGCNSNSCGGSGGATGFSSGHPNLIGSVEVVVWQW